MYRILSLDGGGIRGLWTARILERIENECPGFVAKADLIAGTSTGGILAIGLAKGLAPGDLAGFYSKYGGEIFDDSWLDDLRDLGRLAGSEYGNRNLKKRLVGILGKATRLKDLARRILVPAFDLDNQDEFSGSHDPPRHWKPKFFHNFPGPDSDGDELAVDVALRTAAAPTYFPTYQGFIDGGVFANNPSMAALAQALDKATGGQVLDDVCLLSIGTGQSPAFIPLGRGKRDLDWGYAQWAKPLVSLMIDGAMGVADYQCRRLLGDRYRRVDTVLVDPIGLDDVRAIPRLVELADAQPLGSAVSWLLKGWC